MSKKNFLDSIQSPSPCSKNWDELTGDAQKRFCGSCEKDVHNISAMTRKEARKFAAQNSGKACVRFERLENGKVLTADTKLHKIGRASRIAAGVFSAALTISAVAKAQTVEKPKTQKTTQSQKENDTKTSQISFTIYDALNAIIPGAKVILTNQKTKQEFTAVANQEGIAYFSLLPHGKYQLNIPEYSGFASFSQNIEIKQPIEPNVGISLSAANVTVVGDFVIDLHEIPFFTAIMQEKTEDVKRLISQGFDVNTKDRNKKTALHIAVEHSNLEAVKILLDANPNVNSKDTYNRTPILMIEDIIYEDMTEIVRLLIQKGADVNVQDKEKRTALMFACDDDNLEIVKMLLEAGANPNLEDEDGETALDKTDEDAIKQILRQYGAKNGLPSS